MTSTKQQVKVDDLIYRVENGRVQVRSAGELLRLLEDRGLLNCDLIRSGS